MFQSLQIRSFVCPLLRFKKWTALQRSEHTDNNKDILMQYWRIFIYFFEYTWCNILRTNLLSKFSLHWGMDSYSKSAHRLTQHPFNQFGLFWVACVTSTCLYTLPATPGLSPDKMDDHLPTNSWTVVVPYGVGWCNDPCFMDSGLGKQAGQSIRSAPSSCSDCWHTSYKAWHCHVSERTPGFRAFCTMWSYSGFNLLPVPNGHYSSPRRAVQASKEDGGCYRQQGPGSQFLTWAQWKWTMWALKLLFWSRFLVS